MLRCRGRRQGMVATTLLAALCTVLAVCAPATGAANSAGSVEGGVATPGLPLTLTAGLLRLRTGLVTAHLQNGASGPVLLTIGPCNPRDAGSCAGVLSEFSLLGNFKDAAGNPLYSHSDPASVSWTCNDLACPPPATFVPGATTLTDLQVKEFREHTMYVAPRNPDGSFQPFAPAPACNGLVGTPLPSGVIDPQDTGGLDFCVDVGAITRTFTDCDTVCSSWAGPLTMPVLFVEDPKFMGT